ncbi:unnamed protein product [Parnassius mnemosyne]|uniref:DUF5641 domain-containing protein n=1 Tax=Parnassius mnemosyne TaxID=213953 RepID=A0AAV1LR15_9NEOP
MRGLRWLSVRTLTVSSSILWPSRAACSVLRPTVLGQRRASEMLTQAKSKWFHSRGEVKQGSLVLIKDKTTPPLLWSLGRVMTTYPGVDGITRVAELKTKRGIIRRAVNCICPLPIED